MFYYIAFILEKNIYSIFYKFIVIQKLTGKKKMVSCDSTTTGVTKHLKETTNSLLAQSVERSAFKNSTKKSTEMSRVRAPDKEFKQFFFQCLSDLSILMERSIF